MSSGGAVPSTAPEPSGAPVSGAGRAAGGAPSRDTAPAGSHRRGRRGYFVPGIIALFVLAAIGGAVNFSGLDHQSPSRLDGRNVAVGISQGLQAQRNLSAPPHVTCPSSEPVRAGLSFTCHWNQGRHDQRVRVTETDNRGQYAFSVAGS